MSSKASEPTGFYRLSTFAPYHATGLMKAVDVFAEIPWQAIHLRAPELEKEGIVSITSQAFDESEKMNKLGRSISEYLDLSTRPSREQLVQYVEALKDAGFFRFAKKDFIRARRVWQGMSTRDQKIPPHEMARKFRELIQLGDMQDEFISNPIYQKALGSLFNGLQTPFAQLLALSAWYLAVKRKLGFVTAAGQQVIASLFNVHSTNLQALYEFLNTDRVSREDIQEIFDNYSFFVKCLPLQLQQAASGDLDSFARQLRELAAHLKQIIRFYEECQVTPQAPICEIPDLLSDRTGCKFHPSQNSLRLINVKAISLNPR